jgi:hypothetical protein
MPLSDRECTDIVDRQGRIEHRLDRQGEMLEQVLSELQRLRSERAEEIAVRAAKETAYRDIGWAVVKFVTFIGFMVSGLWAVFHWYTSEGGANWLHK